LITKTLPDNVKILINIDEIIISTNFDHGKKKLPHRITKITDNDQDDWRINFIRNNAITKCINNFEMNKNLFFSPQPAISLAKNTNILIGKMQRSCEGIKNNFKEGNKIHLVQTSKYIMIITNTNRN
jgi:hypothetical protein